MKITPKQFEKALRDFIKIQKDIDILNKGLKRFSPDFNYLTFSNYDNLFLETLKIAMNDKDDWIGYFIYERDSKFTKEHIISDKDGKNLPFRNYNDLYNLIK